MYDTIVIGFGPAGCTAAIFAHRRNVKTLILGDSMSLSQVEQATIIDDWPGDPGINGLDLVEKMRNHVKKLGIEVKEEKAVSLEKKGKDFSVKTEKNSYDARSIVIATGAKHRKGMIKGEDEFTGKGVSYCATCDAPLFKGKKTLVIGGGDSALMYAILLKDVGSDVTLVHRRDKLRGAEDWQKKLFDAKIPVMWDSVLLEIKGDQMVKSAVVMNKKTYEKKEVFIDGIFMAIGTVPTSELAKKIGINVDERGFIKVDRKMQTNFKGVFAAGDCTNGPSKKIATAVGDGAIAGESAYFYLKDLEEKK